MDSLPYVTLPADGEDGRTSIVLDSCATTRYFSIGNVGYLFCVRNRYERMDVPLGPLLALNYAYSSRQRSLAADFKSSSLLSLTSVPPIMSDRGRGAELAKERKG